MEITHVTLTSSRRSRLPLFRDQGAYLLALHKLGKICAGQLVLFALIAEHLHLILLAARAAAGRLAQASSVSLGRIAGEPLAPSYFTAVTSRSHMRWLLRYMLEQPKKHRMPGHPALWVGSCLPDLIGTRLIPGLSLRIREALPEFRDGQALGIMGLGAEPLQPANRATLGSSGARRLVRSTAAALGVDPAMGRNTPAERLARQAAVQLSTRVGISSREIADAMVLSTKTVWRLGRRPVARDVLLAAARRVTLEGRAERNASLRARPRTQPAAQISRCDDPLPEICP